MATTISVYEAISRNLGDCLVKGTVATATATQFDSNALIHPLSDQLKGKEIYIYEGQGAGEARTITTFDPTNNRVTVDPAWTTTPSTNSKFLVFRHWVAEDYENAMNRAMGKVALTHLDEKVATMALIGTQYEYPVPSGFEYISNVRLVPSGYSDYGGDDEVNRIFELPPRYWRIEPNASGSYLIVFDPRQIHMSSLDDEWVKIMGQVKPDFSNTEMPEDIQEFIINFASMLMASQRIAEGNEWRNKFQVFRDLARDLENYIQTPRYGKKVG